MENIIINLAALVGGLGLGGVGGLYLLKGRDLINLEKRRKTAEDEIVKSKTEAKKIREDAATYVQKKRENLKEAMEKREGRLGKQEELLKNKEELINKRTERVKEAGDKLNGLNEEVGRSKEEVKKTDKEILAKLSTKTGKTLNDLRENIIKKYSTELAHENSEKLVKTENELKERADKIAQKYVVNIVQRLCSPTSVETRAVTIKVPKDQIKGKMVGEKAENIGELEGLLDVDIVFNDLPNTISISAFNLVERRIAQKTLEKLVSHKGDIDKKVIHEAKTAAAKETDEELYGLGLETLKKMGIKHDNKDFCRIVGRLKYRTSYGQNIMMHSMEVGWIAAMLGSELGLNRETCKVGGFLHDLGKAIDQDPSITDTHDVLSKKLMEKYGFSWEEVHAAWTHHDAIPQETAEAIVVKAADAISAGRPGARQESFVKYIERIKTLESTAEKFKGVKRAFAISAGREVRVMVDPEAIDDNNIIGLAKDLARTIEDEITYPGKIKVNVIRRTKHTEIAK